MPLPNMPMPNSVGVGYHVINRGSSPDRFVFGRRRPSPVFGLMAHRHCVSGRRWRRRPAINVPTKSLASLTHGMGQLIQARKTAAKTKDDVSRFEYECDDIGNRKQATTNDQEQLYLADELNRYQSVLSGQEVESCQLTDVPNMLP
jgi:hypothetical protein